MRFVDGVVGSGIITMEDLAARALAAVSQAATAAPTERPLQTLERLIYCAVRQANVVQTWPDKINYIENGVEVMETQPGGQQRLVRRPPLRLWSNAAAVNWVCAAAASSAQHSLS